MLLKVILLIVAIVATNAETPARAPYAPAGWRPQVPFKLPGEYLPPAGSTVEISKARVEHAGTFNAPATNTNYLPPVQLDVPQQEEEEQEQQQQTPAKEYGAPDDSFRINYPDDEDATSAPLSQPRPNIRQGRYYIISPDRKLQRVEFRTVQSAEDAKGDEFTAQLRYSSVRDWKDPLYKYNNQGQLERILK